MFARRLHQPKRVASRELRAARQRARTRNSKLATRNSRRGVLLLVVLSLLVLFLMVGTAFVITAKQSEKAAKAAHRGTMRLSAAAAKGDLLDEVLLQIVRDTNNQGSAIRTHSLLADMYGNDGFQAQIANVKWAAPAGAPVGADSTGGQLVQFEIDASAAARPSFRDVYGVLLDPARALSPVDNAYNGQVLTFTREGNVANAASARGVSTRIVGYRPATTTPLQPAVITVMRFNLADGSDLRQLTPDLTPLNGSRILINGRPFNGTGFGFNPAVVTANAPRSTLAENVADVDGTLRPRPMALMPNAAFVDERQIFEPVSGTTTHANLLTASQKVGVPGVQNQITLAARIGLSGIGGGDETYDAPDFQNMALAYLPGTKLIDTVWPDVSAAVPGGLSVQATATSPWESVVLPSWHRPELVKYWQNALGSGANSLAMTPNMLRKVLMRPTWVDHLKFTGSNPELSQLVAAYEAAPSAATSDVLVNRMIYGPWDVDNDNDGVRDSIWVDVGLPVIAGPNGKMVRPLAAIMIIDMDGRLNVNAHGSNDLAQAWTGTGLSATSTVGNLAKSQTSDKAPHGMGFGPADISLAAALNSDLPNDNSNDFPRLLRGDTVMIGGQSVFLPGRYGFPEDTGAGSYVRPGVAGYFDVMSQVGMTGWPQQTAQLSGFGTPPDLRARYGVGVNDLGQPVFEATLQSVTPSDYLTKDSPYELNLSQKTAAGVNGVAGVSSADAPFTLAELERVLRIYDADAGKLPPRLAYLAGIASPDGSTGDVDVNDRRLITTDSFDLPSPNFSVPHEIAGMVASPQSANNARMPRTFAELLETRVRRVVFSGTNAKYFPGLLTNNESVNVRGVMRRLLAPELAGGTRFNLNRPFGNGRDDNNNGVVDEPGEFRDLNDNGSFDAGEETPMWPGFDDQNDAGATAFAAPNATTNFQTAVFPLMAKEIVPDPANPTGIVQDVDHRQLFARHLYVLALTLTAEEKFGLTQAQGGDPQRDQEVARRVAQWAVNIVDFRDPDNIMTPFEYDVNPFNGWGEGTNVIDGEPDAQYPLDSQVQLVWGAERPELVMTETLAMHDRRTDDTASEDVYPPGEQPELMDKEDLTQQDRDYDQLVRPRGTLLIEVHNPWPSAPGASADTHRVSRNVPGNQVERNVPEGTDMGVDLARTHNGDPRNGSPVWRMVFYKRMDPKVRNNQKATAIQAAAWDPDSPDPAKRPTVPVDRSVYFGGRDPGYDDDGVAFFNDFNKNPVPAVRPGRFLVVGAGDEKAAGEYVLPIGDRKGARNPNDPNRDRVRRFVLDTNNVANRVRMSDADEATVRDPTDQGYAIQAPSEAQAAALQIDEAYPGDRDPNNPKYNLCFTDVAIIDQATDEVTGNRVKRKLTVSEPAEGYPDKFRAATWDEDRQEYKATNGFPAIDIPLDGPIGGEEAIVAQAGIGDIEDGNWPSYLGERDRAGARWVRYLDETLCKITGSGNATDENNGASYANVYLQRLANPLLSWNPPDGDPKHRHGEPVNPYLTVDSTAPNLTVFNSRGDDSGEEEDDTPASTVRNYLASHERGYTVDENAPNDKQAMPSVWSEEAPSLEKQRPATVKTESLPAPNNRFRPNRPALASENSYWLNALPANTIGFMNHAFHDSSLNNERRQLVPLKPYEWLTWNNRPFATGNEIMQVPRGTTREMMRSFTNGDDQYVQGQAAQPDPPYVKPVGELDNNGKPLLDKTKAKPAFAHLENFFYVPQAPAPPAPPGPPVIPRGTVASMYRVLAYVHTPSLFVGTETWLNPGQSQFGAQIDMTDAAARQAAATDPRLSFQPPFNAVSEFRDPGRININTIAGGTGERAGSVGPPVPPYSDIWNGLFHVDSGRDPNRVVANQVHAGPKWNEFANSRGGYIAPNPLGGDDIEAAKLQFHPDGAYPTLFGNPFRSPDAADLVPLDVMRRSSIDATLLRLMDPIPTNVWPPGGPPGDTKSLLAAEQAAGSEFADPLRHQYFKYQPMTRLANLVTTRSNVYAVWVTIGFFEVEPADRERFDLLHPTSATFNEAARDLLFNKVYPGGYWLTKEDGVETGEIRRLRGFYMIDRTLPAGFEPGVDHNVENVIRLRRRIE